MTTHDQLEARVATLEEQVHDLANIVGTLCSELFGEFPDVDAELVWKTGIRLDPDDPDDQPFGIWEMSGSAEASHAG
jgi:hypothetical protein